MPLASLRCDTIFQIDLPSLATGGIRLLLADLDNTAAPYGAALPDAALAAWRDALAARGITLFILSNNRSPVRVARFCEALGVPYIAHAGKPRPHSFHVAMRQMGVSPAQTIMVGDQIFTDALGARRAGVRCILVQPIRLAPNPGRYLRYAAELPFRIFIKKGGCL